MSLHSSGLQFLQEACQESDKDFILASILMTLVALGTAA